MLLSNLSKNYYGGGFQVQRRQERKPHRLTGTCNLSGAQDLRQSGTEDLRHSLHHHNDASLRGLKPARIHPK